MKKGQRFTLNGTKWRVAYVNESRAHCESEASHQVTVTDKKTGEPRTFTATSTVTLDISPNSEV